MIKAKDPQLVKIDVAILGFLVGPLPKGTQDAILQVAEIIRAEGGSYTLRRGTTGAYLGAGNS